MDREQAESYASWFRCLADPTRLQLLHLLAQEPGPLTIGELVDAVGVGQSTVSGHVQRLAADEFVFVERMGTTTHVRINDDCLTALPAAADAIMARGQATKARAAHASGRVGAP